jgi:prepilin-type processing-associated H-X9-DG protein
MAKASVTMIAKRLLLIWSPICAILMCGCWRESERLAECANNLRQMWFVVKMYADEWDGKFPPIDDGRGNLMVNGDGIFPEYGQTSLLDCTRCPSNRDHEPVDGSGIADDVTDRSYFYLGWAITTEAEGLALLDEYELLDLAERDDDLMYLRRPPGSHTDAAYRLREGIERFFITDIGNPAAAGMAAAKMPVMWDRLENHAPDGGNVLYFDGHVEFVKYGTFPMTTTFMNRLAEVFARKDTRGESRPPG